MFEAAKSKLEDAWANLETMRRASDASSFRSAFNSFLSNSRAITYALQKDGSKVNAFGDWYSAKQIEMSGDPLLRFIHESRTEDFHEGRHQLTFGTYIEYLNTSDLGPPPKPGASMVVRADGPYWLVDEGTPQERLVPISEGSSHSVSIAVADPPTIHLNSTIFSTDPISLCQLAADYMANLIHEARVTFATNA